MPTLILLLLGLLCVLLAQTVIVLRISYRRNPALFKDNKQLQPINSTNVFFGSFNSVYNFLDRIPYLRRSGTGNEFDFFKAILITAVLVLGLESIGQPLWEIILGADYILFMANIVLCFHPILKGRGRR